MGKVWVRAETNYNIVENGRMTIKTPGDWFELGKHDARNAQATGQISIHNPTYRNAIIPPESGIVLLKPAKFAYENLPVTVGEVSLPYTKNMLWNPEFRIDSNLIPVGLNLLERWEIAVPISDYNLLARDIGTKKEQQETKEIIHDLRVPVYDTRLVFARDCTSIRELFEMWAGEDGDERLSFLRCLYKVKPYVLALPSIWLRK